MNSVYVDGICIGKAKNLSWGFAGGTDQGVVAMGGKV
jgi:hypothetical protein